MTDKKICLRVSTTNINEAVTVTNNRAQYYADLAKQFCDEAREHRNNAKQYAEQNSDVTKEYVETMRATLDRKIDTCVFKDDLPAVSELENDANYANYENIVALNTTINELNESLEYKINSEVFNIDKVLATKLNKSQITNCILEVPQRIKLELNNGVLTLKAGSIVTVPNGKNVDGSLKFDYVAIESDKTVTTATGSGQYMILYKPAGWRNQITSTCFSGDIQPTFTGNYAAWYDTVNNSVKTTGDNGATWSGGWSLPLCLITTTAGVLNSVDQVFNGMGYFGTTVWVDKEVKGLIPNGRNEDGTLNNIEFAVPAVYLRQSDQSSYLFNEFCVTTTGIDISNHTLDEQGNYLYKIDGTKLADRFVAGNITFSQTAPYNITSFQPKQPFRAVDANTPHITEIYKNGTSWYRIWSDGWIEQGGEFIVGKSSKGAELQFIKSFTNVDYTMVSNPVNVDTSCQVSIVSKTASSCYLSGHGHGGAGFYDDFTASWYACGY